MSVASTLSPRRCRQSILPRPPPLHPPATVHLATVHTLQRPGTANHWRVGVVPRARLLCTRNVQEYLVGSRMAVLPARLRPDGHACQARAPWPNGEVAISISAGTLAY